MKRSIHKNYVLFFIITFYFFTPLQAELDDLDMLADASDWHYTERSTSDITPQIVLDLIASPPLLLQDRLQNNLYLFTYPATQQRRRSLLDYPFCLLHDYCLPECGIQWNCWFFYNQTTVDNFTKEGTNITSYWNLNDANIIGDLDLDDFGINVPDVVSLFGFLKMQERRGGIMWGFFYAGERGWNLEVRTPFYYNERNFFVTEEEKFLIEGSIIFDTDDSGSTDEGEIRKHFVSDGLGVGDTRVSAGIFVVEAPTMQLNLGIEMTLPTGYPFHYGFLGSYFSKDSNHPPFNLLELFQLGLPPVSDIDAVKQISMNFFVSAFDKLSANLLQVSMGNGGHIGIAPFFENFLVLGDRYRITTRGAAEYLFPATEQRFYITKKFPQEFEAFEPYTTEQGANPDQAPEKLDFLNEQLIDTFIPLVFPTSIYPGFIIKLSSEVSTFLGETWRMGVGLDLWWQDKERLGHIKANALEIANIRTDIATKPGEFQAKVFATANYYTQCRWFDWCLTGYVDYTMLRYGIGKDFTISIRFTADI